MKKQFANAAVAALVLVCLCGCEMKGLSFKDAITEDSLRPTVSKVLDAQMDYIKPQLDDDLQALLDGEGTKGGPLTGAEIVENTFGEKGGRDYLDFCYAVNYSTYSAQQLDPVMDTAKSVLSKEQYDNLLKQADELEKTLYDEGDEFAKTLPPSQQEAFYKDLKLMVTRAVVLMTAGVVYAAIPKVVIWGKVSAAAAVSIGAGMVAISIMTLYQYYRFGGSLDGMSFEEWLQGLYEIPAADYALTTTIVTIATSMELSPVVTGIILCVFAAYKTTDMFLEMKKTYNFGA